MTRVHRRGWLPAAALALGLALSGRARADPPARSEGELAAARALFTDALHDEQASRFEDALAKFRSVRDVRETANVDYRIAACEEGLGQYLAASTDYRRAIEASAPDDPVAAAARERLDELKERIGPVKLTLPATEASPVSETPAHAASSGPRVVGFSLVAAGSAFIAASGILLALRASDIASLDGECPGGDCPPMVRPSSAESTRDRALVEGPLAAAFSIGGALVAGAGLYLLLRPRPSSDAGRSLRDLPSVAVSSTGARLSWSF